jgi:hypothetical protein
MKTIIKLIPISLMFLPIVTSAQEQGNINFENSGSLWVAVIFGLVASIMVLTYAQKIGGGVLQKVYYSFGVGMLFVVLGLLTILLPSWGLDYVVKGTHDILFVIGMALMAFGAGKLLEAVK